MIAVGLWQGDLSRAINEAFRIHLAADASRAVFRLGVSAQRLQLGLSVPSAATPETTPPLPLDPYVDVEATRALIWSDAARLNDVANEILNGHEAEWGPLKAVAVVRMRLRTRALLKQSSALQ